MGLIFGAKNYWNGENYLRESLNVETGLSAHGVPEMLDDEMFQRDELSVCQFSKN